MNIQIQNGTQTYAYFSSLSGMKGLLTEEELPIMVKNWRNHGALVWLKKPEYNIYVVSEKDMNNWLPDEEEGWEELV